MSHVVPFLAAPNPVPTPIGAGRLHRPPAANVAVRRGAPVGMLRCTRGGARFGVHLELFAHGRAVILPASIGVASPFARLGGAVRPCGCSYAVRTVEPTGVVEVLRGPRLTLKLGDLFAVWGRPLSRTQLVGFSTGERAPVRAYMDGRRVHAPPRTIPLRRHAEIVLELGRYVRPHRSFLFPPGL
jgi:hypothetical protein